jgi:hypothetical protein
MNHFFKSKDSKLVLTFAIALVVVEFFAILLFFSELSCKTYLLSMLPLVVETGS